SYPLLHTFPTRRSSDLIGDPHITLDRSHPLLGPVERDDRALTAGSDDRGAEDVRAGHNPLAADARHSYVKALCHLSSSLISPPRSEEHTSELQSRSDLV